MSFKTRFFELMPPGTEKFIKHRHIWLGFEDFIKLIKARPSHKTFMKEINAENLIQFSESDGFVSWLKDENQTVRGTFDTKDTNSFLYDRINWLVTGPDRVGSPESSYAFISHWSQINEAWGNIRCYVLQDESLIDMALLSVLSIKIKSEGAGAVYKTTDGGSQWIRGGFTQDWPHNKNLNAEKMCRVIYDSDNTEVKRGI